MNTPNPTRRLVGQVNVVGTCYCFGVAIFRSDTQTVPVYLDLVGAATSVEAAWARLAQGKALSIMPEVGDSIVVQPAEGGLFQRYQRRIPEVNLDHLVLVNRAALDIDFSLEQSLTYLIVTDPEQAQAKVGWLVTSVVKVAVFAAWYPYLVQTGQQQRLIVPCQHDGGVEVWMVNLDRAHWTTLISQALKAKRIVFPT